MNGGIKFSRSTGSGVREWSVTRDSQVDQGSQRDGSDGEQL